MEISILKSTEYYSSVGITDDTATFDNTVNRTFFKGEVLQSGTGIFQRSGDDFLAPAWDETDEPTYALNDVLFKDGYMQYVTGISGIGALQPQNYEPSPPENELTNFGSWNHRYMKLGSLYLDTNYMYRDLEGGGSVTLWWDGTSWKYKLYVTNPYLAWSDELYSKITPESYISYTVQTGLVYGMWEGVNVFSDGSGAPIYTGQIFTANQNSRTYRIKVGVQREHITGTSESYSYAISIEQTLYDEQEYVIPVTMLNSSQLNIPEEKAYCLDPSNCSKMWLPKTIIRDGNDLYVRTDTDDIQEEITLSNPTYEILDNLGTVSWGWTYTRPTLEFAPLDGKKYTYIDAPSPIEYTVYGVSSFDTVAINGLIANSVEVTFLPDDGSDPIQTITIEPNTNRDINNRLQPYPTTNIVYAPRDITGHVHMKFISAGSIRIGGITLGMNVGAGFTNLVFGNRFKDYSPYEKDQFGNILYIEGVKTNVYNGTVDVPVSDYDMINRLMASIGGQTVILNGSDNSDNSPVDGENFFSATMVVGRIRGFALKTKLDNKLMAQMATYSFEIEEDV